MRALTGLLLSFQHCEQSFPGHLPIDDGAKSNGKARIGLCEALDVFDGCAVVFGA